MKKLYLLPGNDATNLEWITQISQKVGVGFDVVEIQEYEHWNTGGSIIDWTVEFNNLQKRFAEPNPGEELVVLGKSAGTLMTLLGILNDVFIPSKIIMCGIPIQFGEDQELPVEEMFNTLKEKIEEHSIKLMIVQQELDRVGNAKELEIYLKKIGFLNESTQKSIEFITIEGSDHSYTNFESYIPKVLDFIKK